MDGIINLRLMKHPINWLTIFLMLAIAGYAGHLILELFGVSPTKFAPTPAGQKNGNITGQLPVGQTVAMQPQF